MSSIVYALLLSFIITGVILLGIAALIYLFHRKVPQGKALIANKMKNEPVVTFTGMLVLPVIHKAEEMDISLKTIDIDRRGSEGLICRDNIRADIKVAFFVRVNKTQEDVLKVAQAIGCERASDPNTLNELFNAKFSEALKTVGKQMDFEDLYKARDDFRDRIIELIGKDLNGYVLEDAAIDYLEQTPVSHLDRENILDSQGIRKITELTSAQHVRTNELERDAAMLIKKKDVESQEAILELERQEADARAKQEREIQNIQAREQAEIDQVLAEEHLKAETARIKTDEQVAIQEQNKQREVEIAQKNRERAVAIETEKVELARDLESVNREREVELQRIAKERALEEERKAIADVVRERIVVEKSVAEEEERIKEVRTVAEADRERQAKVIEAEAAAQQKLVADLKAAEAAEQAAKFKAQERITLAQADFAAAEQETQAKIRLAEGIQAERAAAGLADAKVQEALALAAEKQALAEAEGIKQQLLAEAAGLAEKYTVLQTLGDAGREHEEFRLKIENLRAIQLAAINANQTVLQAQAGALTEVFRHANIDIVGGDGAFFERLMQAIAGGKSLDRMIGSSEIAQTALRDYLQGDADLIGDIKNILSNPAVASSDVKNLTLTAFLAQLMTKGDAQQQEKIGELLEKARKLGVDGVN